jgi:hypothetical protein
MAYGQANAKNVGKYWLEVVSAESTPEVLTPELGSDSAALAANT